MTRTLVISDLHLGSRRRVGVLSQPAPLDALLRALDDCDRLVLLGDVVDMTEVGVANALRAATPILRAIGTRLGPDGEVVVVPGNHDLALIRGWLGDHARTLTPQTPVPLDATAALVQLSACLAPARVSVSYPGVWLQEGIWATHGHYLDQHLFPIGAYGIARGWLSRTPSSLSSPYEYELARRRAPSRAPRMLPWPLNAALEALSEQARAWTMPRTPGRRNLARRARRLLLNPRMAPLTATLLGGQMQRFSIPALLHVIEHLEIDADWVLFGHVHRLGPLAGDDLEEWAAPNGRPRIANSGSWLYEPRLVHHAVPPHPYWPGGAIVLESGRAPRAVGLLDGLSAADLH